MIFHIVTLFPAMLGGVLSHSILKRAQDAGRLQVRLYDLRSFTHDKHHVVDDTLYGGAPGMLLKAPPFFEAVDAVRADVTSRRGDDAAKALRVVLTAPSGRPFNQRVAEELARDEELAILCGHYEGVDARVEQALATEVISIGDFVLTGGELPALVILDAVARLQPGVLHDIGSAQDDSFTTRLLQEPQYTRPPEYRGMQVPEALLSGNHAELAKWRRREALLRTLRLRPDLLALADVSDKERAWLEEQGWLASGPDS
ncbi:MAG: tRNA (guanosine(37)-N1)-methyltransferase TrmD [Dehalococcoidia bacterium]|nr:tRNA (guanosine(37)-N1)-methyltransferase TrmD [Dehalococcoidia bacterium]